MPLAYIVSVYNSILCRGPTFFFNDTATTDIYTLSLHDALPIYLTAQAEAIKGHRRALQGEQLLRQIAVHRRIVVRIVGEDRKSTRLNSSHTVISYAVFCLKKKKKHNLLIRQV